MYNNIWIWFHQKSGWWTNVTVATLNLTTSGKQIVCPVTFNMSIWTTLPSMQELLVCLGEIKQVEVNDYSNSSNAMGKANWHRMYVWLGSWFLLLNLRYVQVKNTLIPKNLSLNIYSNYFYFNSMLCEFQESLQYQRSRQ